MIFLYIIAIAISLLISFIFADKFASLAEDKGYAKSGYFWLCFFLGTVGYIMVAALPDLTLHDKLNQLLKNSEPTSSGTPKPYSPPPSRRPISTESAPEGMWKCRHCGTNNKDAYGQCKGCGKYRNS